MQHRRGRHAYRCAVRVLLAAVAVVTVGAREPAIAGTTAATFARDVAPILFQHCAVCHRPGGAASFSLLSYEDARPRARAIRLATRTRSMPPWKPEPGRGGPFVGERRLSDQDIDVIAAWVDAGAPAGNPEDLPPRPEWPGGWRLGQPDLVIEMPAYTLAANQDDVFRKFAIPIPVSATRYVRGIEFQPDNARVVHHANMRIDRTPSSRRLDEQDPEPGYDGVTPFDARYPDGYFLGWTPGQVRPLAPEGMSWRLHPGSDLLLELHLMSSDRPEVIQSRIGFFFTNEAPTKVPFTIRLGKQNLDIPAGATNYRSVDRYVLPVDVEVFGVQPHAHYLARDVKGHATLPDGTSRPLIHISDWDFDWQDSYRYAEPFFLPRGTELTMEFTFDNSIANRRNPHAPPRRVTWGQRSTNEMGDLWIQVLPAGPADREILERDRRPLELAEDIVGFEKYLEVEPDQPLLHDEVALLHLRFGRVAEAANHFRETVRLRPDSAAAHYNLGTTLFQLQQLAGAIASFERAIRLSPTYAEAYNNLGAALRAQGRFEEALGRFRQAIAVRPDDGEALYNLASTLALTGRFDEAVPYYRQALQVQPDSSDTLAELAWILATDPRATAERAGEAITHAERAAHLTARRDIRVLDTLAAAYAAAGRFAQALATARTALALVPAQAPEARDAIRQRLASYRAGLPIRRPD